MSEFSAFIESETNLVKVALKKGSRVVRLDADLLDRAGQLDSIYAAKIRQKEGRYGYWCDVGLSRPGFLAVENGFPALQEGEKVLVQIKREAFLDAGEADHHQGKKPVELTRQLALTHQGCLYFTWKNEFSRRSADPCFSLKEQQLQLESVFNCIQHQFLDTRAPALVWPGPTVVERFLRELPPQTLLQVASPILMMEVKKYCHTFRPDLLQGLQMHTGPLFSEKGLEDIWQSCVDKEVIMPKGRLLFEATSCVTSIDINGSIGQREIINHEMIPTIAEQLQWRRLSGNVIIDFIAASPTARPKLQKALADCLKDDRPRWHLSGWSPLGWLELQRAKRRIPLSMVLSLLQK